MTKTKKTTELNEKQVKKDFKDSIKEADKVFKRFNIKESELQRQEKIRTRY